jgi:hypothetical protein
MVSKPKVFGPNIPLRRESVLTVTLIIAQAHLVLLEEMNISLFPLGPVNPSSLFVTDSAILRTGRCQPLV